MGFEFYKESYAGKIRQISLGKGKNAITVGGESCYPFYSFEGEMPCKPRIAMEIWDMAPEDWPEAALAPFKDVVKDPAAWAKKCVKEYGADMIVLQLKSTDPNGLNKGPDDAVAIVKKVLAAVKVPLIVWGTTNVEKDEEVLKKVAEAFQGENLIIGPVEDKNHKGIGAAAMGYNHAIISSSPIDVNLAKQINILLENLGVSMDKVLIDPTTGGLGYGLEYSYSVMERIRMAALAQGDDKLQLPIINNLGNEIWKCKEAKQSVKEAPTLGDPEKRGILMEAVGAISYLVSGSDILIMRHPEAIRLVRSYVDLLMDGGSAKDIPAITKLLKEEKLDMLSFSPEPDLTIEEEKKAAPAKKKAAPPPPKKAAAKAAPQKAAPKPKPELKVVEEKAPDVSVEEKAKAEAVLKKEREEKERLEKENKEKLAAETKAQAEKEKAEAEEAKAKAEEAALKKAEAKKMAQREAAEAKLREKRAKEREKLQAKRSKEVSSKESMTPSATQKTSLEKMVEMLDRIHRRSA